MAEYTPYRVDVVTPEGPVFEGDAQIVVVPGTAGQLGILANHAPLISSLKPGRTKVTDADGKVYEFATASGFVQVRANEALVLVGEAVSREDIDVSQARARLEEARTALSSAKDGEGDIYRAEREAQFAEVLVDAAVGPGEQGRLSG
jgi:F-type H+-transporting ATPase subunit epsilon